MHPLIFLAAHGFFTRAPISTRPADSTKDQALFRPVSLLVAQSILQPETSTDLAILAAALQRDMQDRFTRRNSRDYELIFAEDQDGEVVGVVGIDVQRLSSKALNEDRVGRFASSLDDRPLLSSLAVSPKFRRRGIALKLCREAERAARRWGYDEVLLKVEANNRKARNLYRRLGYRVVDTDRQAERPIVSGGVRFVQTTQVAMRKDLRFPPPDTIISALAIASAGYWSWITYPGELARALDVATEAQSLIVSGRAGEVVELLHRFYLSS